MEAATSGRLNEAIIDMQRAARLAEDAKNAQARAARAKAQREALTAERVAHMQSGALNTNVAAIPREFFEQLLQLYRRGVTTTANISAKLSEKALSNTSLSRYLKGLDNVARMLLIERSLGLLKQLKADNLLLVFKLIDGQPGAIAHLMTMEPNALKLLNADLVDDAFSVAIRNDTKLLEGWKKLGMHPNRISKQLLANPNLEPFLERMVVALRSIDATGSANVARLIKENPSCFLILKLG